MTTLLSLAVAVIAGLMMTRVVKRFSLPAVTAYLVAGVLIGPYCLGRLRIPGIGFESMEQLDGLKMFSEVALGFIAFAIGNEFRLSSLRETGRQATIVGIVQALMAAVFVDIALVVLHFILGNDKLSIPQAITLGAIATATAPAATLMVVRQYKAKGKLTDILLPVVALDDAVGLVVFAESVGIARAIHSGAVELTSILLEPALEIVLRVQRNLRAHRGRQQAASVNHREALGARPLLHNFSGRAHQPHNPILLPCQRIAAHLHLNQQGIRQLPLDVGIFNFNIGQRLRNVADYLIFIQEKQVFPL